MTGSQVAGEVRTLFDTSVLVPALVDQLENHEAALRALKDYTTGGNSAYCSAHALAETYATVSALPIDPSVSPAQAQFLIQEAVVQRMEVVPLTARDYRSVIRDVAAKELRSGAVYDALHVHCARKERVHQILTYNLSDFRRFRLDGIQLATP